MAFNISQFRSNGLKRGGARPSFFEVDIFTPFSSTNAARTSVLVQAASIPPANIRSFPAYYFGRPIKLAGERDFPDWDVEIMNDEDFALRKMFENWSNRINALVSNRQSPDMLENGYKSSAIVRQYGQGNDILASYNFEGLWPTSVGPIRLNWQDGNSIETYTVTFSYDWWEPGDADQSTEDDYSGTISPDGISSTFLPRG